jgi:hypothetical protein
METQNRAVLEQEAEFAQALEAAGYTYTRKYRDRKNGKLYTEENLSTEETKKAAGIGSSLMADVVWEIYSAGDTHIGTYDSLEEAAQALQLL